MSRPKRKAKCQRYIIEFKEDFPNATPCLKKAPSGATYKGKRIAFVTRLKSQEEYRADSQARFVERQEAEKKLRRRGYKRQAGVGIGTVLVGGIIAWLVFK